MTHIIYVYEHCPYCVKARMIFGVRQLPVQVEYFLNDDVDGPVALIGAKQVPILRLPDGSHMPESMDIVRHIDAAHGPAEVATPGDNAALLRWMERMKPVASRLAMPRWVRMDPPLPEFETHGAIDYFTAKKEASIGEFDGHLDRTEEYRREANALLAELPALILGETSVHAVLSEDDFHLYALLHTLSIAPGLAYPDEVEHYRRHWEQRSGVPLLAEAQW